MSCSSAAINILHSSITCPSRPPSMGQPPLIEKLAKNIYASWVRVALGLFVAEPPDLKLAKNFEYLSTSSCSKAATAVLEDATGVFGSLSVDLLASRSWPKS